MARWPRGPQFDVTEDTATPTLNAAITSITPQNLSSRQCRHLEILVVCIALRRAGCPAADVGDQSVLGTRYLAFEVSERVQALLNFLLQRPVGFSHGLACKRTVS
jgi:hypothetical protein